MPKAGDFYYNENIEVQPNRAKDLICFLVFRSKFARIQFTTVSGTLTERQSY